MIFPRTEAPNPVEFRRMPSSLPKSTRCNARQASQLQKAQGHPDFARYEIGRLSSNRLEGIMHETALKVS